MPLAQAHLPCNCYPVSRPWTTTQTPCGILEMTRSAISHLDLGKKLSFRTYESCNFDGCTAQPKSYGSKNSNIVLSCLVICCFHLNRVVFGGGQDGSFDVTLRGKKAWQRIDLPQPITTDRVLISVVQVEKFLFGGFAEIRLYGCGPSLQYQQTTRKPSPSIIDWYSTTRMPDQNQDLVRHKSKSRWWEFPSL